MKYPATTLLLAIGTSAATAASLAPNDPSISGSLGLWLTDAANNFDGSSWSDSSGNGNNASPVGTVDVGGPVTYSAPVVDLTTTNADHNNSSVRFSGTVDDLLVSNGIFGGSGSGNLTVFVSYHVVSIGGNPNLTRPAGLGSIAATQANAGNHFNAVGLCIVSHLGHGTPHLHRPAIRFYGKISK